MLLVISACVPSANQYEQMIQLFLLMLLHIVTFNVI